MNRAEKLRAAYNKNGIDYLQFLYDELEGEISAMYPSKPSKPMLLPKHTPEDVLAYAEKLMAYGSEEKDYKAKKEVYQTEKNNLRDAMMEIIKEDVGFYNAVPKERQDKVWYYIIENSDNYPYSIRGKAEEVLSTFYD